VEIVAHRAQVAGREGLDAATALSQALAGPADRVELDVFDHDGRLVVAHDRREAGRPGVLRFDDALALIAGSTRRLLADVKGDAAGPVGLALAARDLGRRTVVCGELEAVELAGRISAASRAWTLPTAGRLSAAGGRSGAPASAAGPGFLGLATRRAKQRIERAGVGAVEAGRCDAVCVEHRFVTPGLAQAIHAAGGRLLAWTVDEPAEARRLVGLGVDGLITNDPAGIGSSLS
jgi:glycerophosphoryl diester phosphodiesterase